MKLTPQRDVGLGALAVLLGTLAHANNAKTADATFKCTDLAACTAPAQCNNGGDHVQCELRCVGGGTIWCNFKSG